MARLRYTFREVVTAVQDMREFTQNMANLSANQPQESAVVVQGPDLTQVFLTNTGQLLTMIVVTGILLFFLLANGYLFLQKTVHVLRSEEHTSELQSLMRISYAVFCLKKKNEHTRLTV